MLYPIILIATGGAIGAVLRFITLNYLGNLSTSSMLAGTSAVNLAGSFIAGFLFGFFENSGEQPELKKFLFIGVLGSFTTFSTFSLESLALIQDRNYTRAAQLITLNNLGGILLAGAGYYLGSYLSKKAGGNVYPY